MSIALSPEPTFPPEILGRTRESVEGALPVLLTVPHDGTMEVLEGVTLSQTTDKLRDLYVRPLTHQISMCCLERKGAGPTILAQLVHRRCRTAQIRAYFAEGVRQQIHAIYARHGRCLHLDLHGFGPRPSEAGSIYQHDIIVGTNHRKTVQGSDVDVQLHDFLSRAGYRVYVPSAVPVPGERFMAAMKDYQDDRLIHVSTELGLPGVVAMQLEIARRFRTVEVGEAGRALAERVSTFVMQYR